MRVRFETAAVRETQGGYVVIISDRPLKTPAKAPLLLPGLALAEAVAAEWRAQTDKPRPEIMPLTRLVATAIDRIPAQRPMVIEQIAAYAAGSDLLCYRAEEPPELVARQAETWQPLLDWAAERYGAALAVTSGIAPVPQPEAALAAFAEAVADLDDMRLAALGSATAACGSLVVALALASGRVDADEAFEVSQLEETWQIEQWGEDAEATERRAGIRAEIAAAAQFLALCDA